MKRYKSLLSLKWVAALLLVVGFVSCADEEIISGKTDVIEGIETELVLLLLLPLLRYRREER